MKQASWRQHFGRYIYIYTFFSIEICVHTNHFWGHSQTRFKLEITIFQTLCTPVKLFIFEMKFEQFLVQNNKRRKKTHTTLFVNWWYLFEIATIKWNHAHFLLLCGKIYAAVIFNFSLFFNSILDRLALQTWIERCFCVWL